MGKTVFEYLGTGVAIAGAGICIAGATGVAYAETEPSDPSSASEAAGTDSAEESEPADDAEQTDEDPRPRDEEPEPRDEESEPRDEDSFETVSTSVDEPQTPDWQTNLSQSSDETEPGDGYSATSTKQTESTVELAEQDTTEPTPDATEPVREPEPEPEPTGPVTAIETEPVPTATPTEAVEENHAHLHTAATGRTANATVTANPVENLLVGVLTFLGLNTPEAPDNPLGALVWGLFRRIESSLGVVPRPGDPTVNAPTAEGVVTGEVGVKGTPGLPVTFTGTVDPAQGTVVLKPDGSFTFTPSQTARLAAGAPGGAVTATFTVTASNGLAATNTTLTVPVSPLEAGTVLATINVGGYPSEMVVSPDGASLYIAALVVDLGAGTGTYVVKVIDTGTNTVRASIPLGDNGLTDLALTPDGTYAYVTTFEDKAVAVIDTATNTVTATIQVNGSPSEVAFTPDGAYAYVTNSSYPFGYVAVIDTATQTKIGEIPVSFSPSGLAIADTPMNALAYVAQGNVDGAFTVRVIDTAVNITVATISLDTPAGAMVASPDGSHVYISDNSTEGLLYVIDTATNTIGHTIVFRDWLSSPVVSPDGARVYVLEHSDEQVEVRVIDTSTGAVFREPLTVGDFSGLAVSADGSMLYAANSTDDTISVIYTGNRAADGADA
ncbi:hypothetical protein BVC93_13110 [Mycobacterium sp. MS1601]|uniref:YncE family protein n=1 Tax=Mycobacterium sp. MS1601 TaxID=1936029 RepID=UPI000979158D|nr:YncE family protein [Mycobacterium sp. MS1601]AQA03202.1 hypothetical protein BVC93_13110 [Mycobacterium sp. MS1601]